MTGIVGQFFKSFALTIAFAVAMSLLVAFTLDPMLSSRFVRFIPLEERTRTRIGRFFERIGHSLRRARRRVSPACSAGRSSSPWTVARDGRSWSSWPACRRCRVIGTEFVPDEDRGEFQRASSTCRPARRSTRAWRTWHRSSRVVQGDARSPAGLQHRRLRGRGPLRRRHAVKPTKKNRARRAASTRSRPTCATRLAKIPLLKMPRSPIREFMQGAPTQPPLNVYRARRRHARSCSASATR